MKKGLRIIDESGDKRYFTQIPNMVINHSTAYEQSLYLIMKRIAGEIGSCYASLNFLAVKMGVNRKTVTKNITKLLKRKWLMELEPVKIRGGSVRQFKIIDLWQLNMREYEFEEKNQKDRLQKTRENHRLWAGGISKIQYPKEFNPDLRLKVRTRDNFTCCLCGKTEKEELKELNRILCVNHIDFNKNNCAMENLNTLCLRCNIKINENRDYWKEIFKQKRISGIVEDRVEVGLLFPEVGLKGTRSGAVEDTKKNLEEDLEEDKRKEFKNYQKDKQELISKLAVK